MLRVGFTYESVHCTLYSPLHRVMRSLDGTLRKAARRTMYSLTLHIQHGDICQYSVSTGLSTVRITATVQCDSILYNVTL